MASGSLRGYSESKPPVNSLIPSTGCTGYNLLRLNKLEYKFVAISIKGVGGHCGSYITQITQYYSLPLGREHLFHR